MGVSPDDSRPGSPIDHQPTTFSEIVKKWPKQTFTIIANELCERFSFYGMRAVLTLYFFNVLGFSSSHSAVLFHAFTVVCYSSPLLGSILADGFIGKFWTIFFVSIFYACGQILLAFSSIYPSENPYHPYLDLLGLLIVGLGTGGIKPCVSAFGGDQFPAHWTRMISIFFSIFYFSINLGSVISIFLTPHLRTMQCFGSESCYPLAFGVPAILMIMATLVFMSGSLWYKKVPTTENAIFKVVGIIWRALRNKLRSSSPSRSHWLEHSLDGHDCSYNEQCRQLHGNCAERRYIEDVKRLIRVVVMLLPVPMFWALYDQQGSTWVLQAVSMNSRIVGDWELLPDQMSVFNAVLVMILIPVFQTVVYPTVEKLGIQVTMLRKMSAGGLFTALSFFVCGFLQLFVNGSLPTLPMSNEAHLTIINTFPTCDFKVIIDSKDPFDLLRKSGMNAADDITIPISFINGFQPNITFDNESPNCPKFTANPSLTAGVSYILTVSPNGWSYRSIKLEKPSSGNGEFGISLNTFVPCDSIPSEVTWKECTSGQQAYKGVIGLCKVASDEIPDSEHPCDPQSSGFYQLTSPNSFDIYDYSNDTTETFGVSYPTIELRPGRYRFYYIKYTVTYSKTSKPSAKQTIAHPMDIPSIYQKQMGGVYLVSISTKSKNDSNLLSTTETLIPYNHVSILWQVPQFVLITIGEVMFSITGLEFCYSEASPHLKSVVQALWLFTTAIGDLIDVAILSLNLFTDNAVQMFVFGGCMVIVILVFSLLAMFYYQYAEYSNEVDTEKMVSDEEKTHI